MTFYRLIYISSGYRKFGADELRAILDVSVKNNALIDVTGMLLYLDGNFLQLLEGRQEDVEALYDRIEQDRRHMGPVLSRSKNSERLFPDWAMGLKAVDPEKDTGIAGAFRLGYETVNEKIQGLNDDLSRKMIEIFMQVNAGPNAG